MNICIETPNKEAWDLAQKVCFKHGWDWEGEEWAEWDFDLQKDVWKSDPEFVLNNDGWHEDVTHLCVIDGSLCTNYADDGNPVADGFQLKTIEELERLGYLKNLSIAECEAIIEGVPEFIRNSISQDETMYNPRTKKYIERGPQSVLIQLDGEDDYYHSTMPYHSSFYDECICLNDIRTVIANHAGKP